MRTAVMIAVALYLAPTGAVGVQAFVGGVGQVQLIVDVGGYFD